MEEIIMRNDWIEQHGGYWNGELLDFPVDEWIFEVQNKSTRLGYWEWAFNRMEEQEGG